MHKELEILLVLRRRLWTLVEMGEFFERKLKCPTDVCRNATVELSALWARSLLLQRPLESLDDELHNSGPSSFVSMSKWMLGELHTSAGRMMISLQTG